MTNVQVTQNEVVDNSALAFSAMMAEAMSSLVSRENVQGCCHVASAR